MVVAGPAAADEGILPPDFGLTLKGYIEGRLVMTDHERSWQDGGLGKLRYGGASDGGTRTLARAEGALIVQPQFGFDITGNVVLAFNGQQRTAVDVVEAFLQYKPAPTGSVGVRGKVGAFFPPISLENTGIAWTSPYTITSSAINSWIGEELKTIGGEITGFYHDEDIEVGITGALFGKNDPAGTLLAWRGWSLNDRETGLFDRLRLAPIRITRPTGVLYEQAPTEEPFHEIDGRVGYYIGLSIDHADFGQLNILRYDNRADDHAFEHDQWAWHTKFWAVGYKVQLPADIDLVTQVMKGSTSVITIPAPVGPIVYPEFWSAYLLLSKAWGRHRLSLRADRFGADDEDGFPDINSEHGNALTASYIFRPVENHRLTLEVVHVDSRRRERSFLGLPANAHETQIQASYRIFFNYAP
jgi:hypothetical protein